MSNSKKKKNPKNAFSFYLDDAVIELRRNGINVRTKWEAVGHVHEKWKNMSLAEKAPYEEKVKEWKLMKNNRPRAGRLDCTGNPLDRRIDMDKVKEDHRKEQRKYLMDKWQSKPRDQVIDEHFFIISFQSYFEFPNEEGYQPCEIACVDFSLRTGINREWHAMINPGPIKLGMGAESKIFSERTHKIPIWGFEPARSDYMKMWQELLEFVNPGLKMKVYPPLFCKISELTKTNFCVDYLAQLAGVSNRLSKIYQWEGLVAALYTHAGIQAPSLNIIEDGANSTMYDYESNTKCGYHDEQECVYCAMLTVKKCSFWMSDAFSEIYGYEVTENHLPARQPPQYTIINPNEMTTGDTKRKFLGAYSNPPFDPNLPFNLQKNPLTSCYNSETSESVSSFASRDIRYRPKYQLVPGSHAFGRGTAIAPYSEDPVRSDDIYESLSVTDTNDDVASSILSDTESDATCHADDEESEMSFGSSILRRPKAKPIFQSHLGLRSKEKLKVQIDGASTDTTCVDTDDMPTLHDNLQALNFVDTPDVGATGEPLAASREPPAEVISRCSIPGWPSVLNNSQEPRFRGRGRFLAVGRGRGMSQCSQSSQE